MARPRQQQRQHLLGQVGCRPGWAVPAALATLAWIAAVQLVGRAAAQHGVSLVAGNMSIPQEPNYCPWGPTAAQHAHLQQAAPRSRMHAPANAGQDCTAASEGTCEEGAQYIIRFKSYASAAQHREALEQVSEQSRAGWVLRWWPPVVAWRVCCGGRV
jgi:hypothetical protein